MPAGYGILCCLIIGSLHGDAQAQRRQFGLGVVLGSPTGITFKQWMSRENAWSGGVAWSLRANEHLHLHAAYNWHDFDLIDEPRTAFYYGVGGRLVLSDNSRLGVRVPFGITHLFRRDPFDIFFELAPIFDLIPETRFDLEGGIGARYYFNQVNRR